MKSTETPGRTGRRAPARTTAPTRVVIEHVRPEVDAGRFPVKRTVGETVAVTADIHAEGHDVLAAVLCWRRAGEERWSEAPMSPLGNDGWQAQFVVTALEPYRYTVEAWPDQFRTWLRGLSRKLDAQNAEPVDLLVGALLLEEMAKRAKGADGRTLAAAAAALRQDGVALETRAAAVLEPALAVLADRYTDRSRATRYTRDLMVDVERERARFSTWYELFPRSASPEPGRHGTLRDVITQLDYVAELGFDVLYLPPIHPIGRTLRKGKNNSVTAQPGDVGSPWAIGAAEGGHTAIHPDLGTIDDFRALVAAAGERGIEVALDLAFQCAPDHPWVSEHPEWFHKRPDGTIQYAENPPKKYQDIYPLDFETPAWRELYEALRQVVLFWVGHGVRVFRVDNPHTKPYSMWEWLIGQVRREHPEVVFLAEAFTRPRVMYQLAKLGFSQGYTYFTWRNTKEELTAYLADLTAGEVHDVYRPSFWPNTPDILPEPLQYGGPAVFQARLVLAATLAASYGIYGPAYELMEHVPVRPGAEEYLDSEKYQLRRWDRERADSLRHFIARVNRIRRENPALQTNATLRFHTIDNPQMLAYSKTSLDGGNVILTVVNLDPHHVHSGWLELPPDMFGLAGKGSFQVHDLLSDARFFWSGPRNFVQVDPAAAPAHVFRLRRRVHTERDFDYFL